MGGGFYAHALGMKVSRVWHKSRLLMVEMTHKVGGLRGGQSCLVALQNMEADRKDLQVQTEAKDEMWTTG